MLAKCVERLINLCALLLQPGEALTAAEIRRRIPQYREITGLEAFRKALQRDVATLRDLGVPVEVGEESEYSIPERSYALPIVTFIPQESQILALAVRAASALGPSLKQFAESAWAQTNF